MPTTASATPTPFGPNGNNYNNNNNNHNPSYNSMLFSPAASSFSSPSAGLELEVHWDPVVIRSELRMATTVLSHRGLKQAAKWASEQLVGLVSRPDMKSDTTTSTSSTKSLVWQELEAMTDDKVLFAKTLLELGEYLHAAATLSEPNSDVTTMTPPLKDLSPFGVYLRAYSLYLAGEQRKEQDYLELQSEAQKQQGVRNPYLSQLLEELGDAYDNNKLDAFGLYVYGFVLKQAHVENLTNANTTNTAQDILVESVLQFPLNWSAWLELCDVVIQYSSSAVEHEIEQALNPTLGSHYMYHFFCAHLMGQHPLQAHDDALVLYERLCEPVPGQPVFQSWQIKTQMGVVLYHLRDFEHALDCFEHAPAFSLEHKDVYSNILYVKEDRVALSQLAHQAVWLDKYRPETCCIVGNYYSLKQQRQKAVSYFQRALKLDRNYTSAWTLMGHEYVELKQTERAMEAYRRAVTVSPKDYRAWYGLGQTYELLSMHLYALHYYRKAATLRPYDARMWCAVGLCLVALHRTSDAIKAYERAVSQDDSEGIATQKLATLYRQEGRLEEAAQCSLRHLELRYLVTHPNPDANNGPTLDAIVQGVVVEAPEAEALMFLASYHKNHGAYDTASLFCSRLLEYPGPEKEQAKGLLRDLRARTMHNNRGAGPRGTQKPHNTPSHQSFEFSP